MGLSSSQLEELNVAICDAFNEGELEQLVRHRLGEVLHNVVKPGPLRQQVFDLINFCERRETIDELIQAVTDERPQNEKIRRLNFGLLARGTKLGDVWSQLAKWLRENYRVFNTFGPPAKNSGVDRSLWLRQKETVLTPNNKAIAATLHKFRELFPSNTCEIVDRMLNHLDAYATNSEVRVDYNGFTFPSEFATLVGLGAAGHYSTSYDRSGAHLWVSWALGACPAKVLQAYVIGSIVDTPLTAGDVDILLLYLPPGGSYERYDRWLERAKSEAELLFGIPLHMSSFQSPKEGQEFVRFLQQYRERAGNPPPVPVQPKESRL